MSVRERRERRERLGAGLLAVLVFAAVLAAFSPALTNGILRWDDLLFVGKDAALGWDRAGLRWAFGSFHLGQYVPLACLSYIADFSLWGGDAGGYHLTGVLWHAAACLIWYGFWRRLLSHVTAPARRGDAAYAAAAAALLFGLHPLRVESVAWIAERRDVLCGFFYAAALRLYLESCLREKSSAAWRAGALACFAVSLLSKAASVSLPATLLILDVYPLRRLPADPRSWFRRRERAVVLEKLPFAVLSAAICATTIPALRRGGLIDGLGAQSLAQRAAAAAHGVLFYVRKEFWPFPLLPVYDMPLPFEPASPRFLAWGAAAAVSAWVVWRLSRRRPALGAPAAHYAAALLPVCGLVGGGLPHLGADRFSYFPNLAFSALAAAGLFWALARTRRRPAVLAAAAAVLAALGAASWSRCREWRDDGALWRAALAADPESREGRLNLSADLAARGLASEAAAQAELAAGLNPASPVVWTNLGAARLALGRAAGAEEAFTKAYLLNPLDADARRGLGRSLIALNRPGEAVEALRAAADLAPGDAVPRYELGNALFRLGRLDPAGEAYLDALRVDPGLAAAHTNLGRVFERQGLPDRAVEEYRVAARLGNAPEAVFNWANVESARGRGEVAIRLYREALRLDPGLDDARFNWGNALARAGRLREAAAQYRLLLARRPRDAGAAENLRRVSASGRL